MKMVGHLVNTEKGPEGEPGIYYNYILAGNGLFIQARSPLLEATIPVTYASVRGLPSLERRVELPKGRVPRHIYDLALSIFYADPSKECYLAVTFQGEYHLEKPCQEADASGVNYERLSGTVIDIHSHGVMAPWFSSVDNRDEQGFCLYIVIGNLNTFVPVRKMRVGVYGYFDEVSFREVFLV